MAEAVCELSAKRFVEFNLLGRIVLIANRHERAIIIHNPAIADRAAEAVDRRPEAGGVMLSLMRDHHKLRAFEIADQLAVAVYEHSRDFRVETGTQLLTGIRNGLPNVEKRVKRGKRIESRFGIKKSIKRDEAGTRDERRGFESTSQCVV